MAANGQFNAVNTIPAGAIGNIHFSNQSTDLLGTDKHQPSPYCPECNFNTAIAGTPATREELKYTAKGAGTIRGFHAYLNVDGSSTSITFDLKKNGVSILTAVITITDSTGDGVIVSGTLSSSTFVAGDRFSYAMTVSSSTGAQGPVAWAVFTETAAIAS